MTPIRFVMLCRGRLTVEQWADGKIALIDRENMRMISITEAEAREIVELLTAWKVLR